MHNFIWGSLNPGGMIESYWYENYHIYSQNPDGSYAFDHRHHFLPFYDFVSSLPLNSGDYQDAQAATSTEELRAWGQKDLTRGQAHLWIQNRQHTWKNVVDGTPITPITGVITLTGFAPGEQYRGVWIDPYQDIPAQAILAIDVFTAQPDGSLILPVEALSTDVAVKIAHARDVAHLS